MFLRIRDSARKFFHSLPTSDYRLARFSRCYSTKNKTPEGISEDHAGARQWLAKFHIDTIPRNFCEVKFSKSSGPGGQHVNKYEFQIEIYYISQNLCCLE